VCVRATGATVGRRRLFRAASVGCVASVLNGSLGVATRIASLRRTAPRDSPRVPALLAAAVPIISVEITLTALFSFTLVGPLGVPWWAPAVAVAAAGATALALGRLSDRPQARALVRPCHDAQSTGSHDPVRVASDLRADRPQLAATARRRSARLAARRHSATDRDVHARSGANRPTLGSAAAVLIRARTESRPPPHLACY
jgi:hypothetical protein